MPSKKTDLAPYVKDEKYASIALSVLLEIALDLSGGSKIVPASLYDADILSERYNGIIGVPSAVILCSGFLDDDVLTMDDFKKNYPKIVNEVRDWFINKSTIDIDDLIPSIKNCIKTIEKEWDDYMNIHGKLLCDSIKKLANEEIFQRLINLVASPLTTLALSGDERINRAKAQLTKEYYEDTVINADDFTIKTNPKDTIVAMGGTKLGRTDEMVQLLTEQNQLLAGILNKEGTIVLNGTQMGTAMAVGSYRS